MRNHRQSGFSLLEVAVAGGIALMIIMGLFSAIRLSNDQTAFVNKKKDELNLLSDMRYMLAHPKMCAQVVKWPNMIKPNTEIALEVRRGSFVKKDENLVLYGLRVNSLKILEAEQITESRTFEETLNNGDKATQREEFELRKHKLVRIVPPEDKPGAPGILVSWVKTYYVDVGLTASGIGTKTFQFRTERVARVSLVHSWSAETGDVKTCSAPGAQVATSEVVPPDFDQRLGVDLEGPKTASSTSGETPNKGILEILMDQIKRLEKHQEGLEKHQEGLEKQVVTQANQRDSDRQAFAQAGNGGGGGAPSGSTGQGGSVSNSRGSFGSMGAGGGGGSEGAPAGGLTAGLDRTPSSLAVVNHPGTTSNDGAPGGEGASPRGAGQGGTTPKPAEAAIVENFESSCAVNMTAAEALSRGYPVVKHGEQTNVPLPDCMQKKFICWNGSLTDLGLPPRKQDSCGAALELSAEENARQLGAKVKKPEEDDCAVNVTLAEAKRNHLPTFKSGERLMMSTGECEEKSFVCWDGRLRDEGLPARKVQGCVPMARK